MAGRYALSGRRRRRHPAGLTRSAKDMVPQRRADTPAGLWSREVMKHVPAPQKSTDPRAWPAMVDGEVDVVVGEVADEEEREEDLDVPRSQQHPKGPIRDGHADDGQDRRHHEPCRVVRDLMMDTVHDELQAPPRRRRGF